MAVLKKDFYKGTDLYNDGDVEQDILEYVTDSKGLAEDDFVGDDYAKAYHLSPIRENILNWYPFDKSETALEIGSGCGAISGLLTSRLKKVTSVELSLRRASINFERHKDIENLEIIVGNFNDVILKEKYDYVILNGVLEYAMLFTKDEDPFVSFLSKMKNYLKPSGKLIIAIENKLGLKYFNGSPEDHTNNYFEGVNNYTLGSEIRTFSKAEIGEMMSEVGFRNIQFYYPYPDYKFPSEIFSEKTINTMPYGRTASNIEKDKIWLFEERQVIRCLQKEMVMSVFSNSFLIIASNSAKMCDVLYAKLNSDRNEKFRIGTIIKEKRKKKYVIKKALNINSEEHIKKIAINSWNGRNEKIEYLPANIDKGELKYRFIDGEGLASGGESYSRIKEKISDFFMAYFDSFDSEETNDYYTEQFIEWFGEKKINEPAECVENVNIDLILDNIFEENDHYTLIDSEWIYSGLVPKSFVIWRCLNEAYYSGIIDSKIILFEKVMSDFGISGEEERAYREWANHFATKYVGAFRRDRISKPVLHCDLRDIITACRKKIEVVMKLYLDYGEGFREDRVLTKEVEIKDNIFEVEFNVKNVADIKRIRFDPVDYMFCKCRILNNGDGVLLKALNNVAEEDGMDIFVNLDPQYSVEGFSSVISIKGELIEISNEMVSRYL